jgi:hypothetical protein
VSRFMRTTSCLSIATICRMCESLPKRHRFSEVIIGLCANKVAHGDRQGFVDSHVLCERHFREPQRKENSQFEAMKFPHDHIMCKIELDRGAQLSTLGPGCVKTVCRKGLEFARMLAE